MDSLGGRVVALLEELQAALGASSLHIEAWMPVTEIVSIEVEDGAWIVSDRGKTHHDLRLERDEWIGPLDRAVVEVVERACSERRVEIVVEPEGEGYPDRIVLVRRPAGSDGLVEAAIALSEAIDEIFVLHRALPGTEEP